MPSSFLKGKCSIICLQCSGYVYRDCCKLEGGGEDELFQN